MEPRSSFRRLNDLESAFVALEQRLPAGPAKDAFSILHGMVQELWRNAHPGMAPTEAQGLTIEDIANLYKTAPSMDGPAENTPLPVGTPAPDFSLPDASGRLISLADFRRRPLVLVFYPLDWSPTCSDQLSLYQAEREEFEKRGAQLVAISVDSIYSHGAWAAVRGLTFPLLADFEPKGAVARRYHVYRERDGFSERALYVIDSDGVIRYAHVSPHLSHVPDIEELYRTLDGLATPLAAAA
jgi:peroxiredoxin